MNLIDTSVLSEALLQGLALREEYFLAPDVVEEVEMARLVLGRRLPSGVREASLHSLFDQSIYLRHYKDVLNEYKGRSFYNMTGFGDVSILATVRMFLSVFDAQNEGQLFDVSEQILVFTTDPGLARRVAAAFSGRSVQVRGLADLS